MYQTKQPIGRFAPSPTGALHLGSLTTAVGSFCHIKHLGGKWLLRIEDTDFERCQIAFSNSILYDLEKLGLHWDDSETYQSERLAYYNDAISQLKQLTYPCDCSRKTLEQISQTHHNLTHANPIYPRICLPKPNQPKTKPTNAKLRLQLPDVNMAFVDKLQGIIWQNPQKMLGDVVIKRNNGMINYIFACAIDDGLQGVSHIMRGLDIIEMTSSQLFIQESLGLPSPDYFYHLPLLYNADGQKLSKQNLATPIDTNRPSELLITALTLLRQPIDQALYHEPPSTILQYAIKHWRTDTLAHKTHLGVMTSNQSIITR